MHTSAEFLDLIRERQSLPSDYAIAPMLGITTAAVSRYRGCKEAFSDKMAERVADLVKMDEAYILACAHAQRSKSPKSRTAWAKLAALALAASLSTGANAAREKFDNNTDNLPIMRTMRRMLRPRPMALMA